MTVILKPTNELVAIAWLAGVPGLDPTKIGTKLPKDQRTWEETGFVRVTLVGGGSSGAGQGGFSQIHVPVISPVLRLSGFANGGQSKKPPFWKANNLLELVRAATYDETSEIRRVDLVGDYPTVRVISAYLISEPRRIELEPSSYARYDADFQIHWVAE